jgi:hypothetical protein
MPENGNKEVTKARDNAYSHSLDNTHSYNPVLHFQQGNISQEGEIGSWVVKKTLFFLCIK